MPRLIVNLVGASFSGKTAVGERLQSKGYNVMPISQSLSAMEDRTNIDIVTPAEAKETTEYYQGSDIKVITIYLQVDENTRAERIADSLCDQTIRDYITNNKYIAEVWDILLADRKMFAVVEADYIVNGNQSLDKVVRAIDKIIIREE